MIKHQTLPRFIRSEERKRGGASGEFSELLSAIGLAVKIIAQLVATAGFKGLYGYTGASNVQGEAVRQLDEEADKILVDTLGASGHFGLLVSEERDSTIATEFSRSDAKYVVAFDPLDGSTNIGSNIPVGTIFSIFRKKDLSRPATHDDFLQPAQSLVAAGYSVYGAKTSFVYSVGNGVHGFTLDPTIGEFLLTEERIEVPQRGSIYSVNEGYSSYWPQAIRDYVSLLKSPNSELKTPYSARYVGSLIADFDRNLRRGGIFLYPADSRYPQGKLRLLYECMPLAYIMSQAGGMTNDGCHDLLSIVPESIHQRSGFISGSPYEMRLFNELALPSLDRP
jgi:fructose-1,6-bisphosphatase I